MMNDRPRDTRIPSLSLEPPVWDREGMMYRMAGNERLAGKVLAAFLEDAPQRIRSLSEMTEAGDMPGLERLGHAMKGSAANVGGEALRCAALALETAGKSGDAAAAQAAMEDVQDAFESLARTLRDATTADGCEKE